MGRIVRTPRGVPVVAAIIALFTVWACAPAAAPSPTEAPRPPAATQAPATQPAPAAAPAARSAPTPARKLNVVATTTHIQDFARNVGGDRITVVPILGPDDDAHDYQPTAEDARKIAQADVVLAIGIGLEPWLDALARNARPGVQVVELAGAAKLQIEKGDDPEEPEGDPHVWQDPANTQKMVDVIRDALARLDAPGQTVYAANAAAYNRQLDQLDQQIKQQIATIPSEQRRLVTNHDAFGYYVRHYGLVFVGSVIPSLSTEAEPSAGEVRKLIQDIKEQHVKAIFTETNLSPRLEQQIAQEAGIKIYSNLYGDALGAPGSEGDTYIKAMLFNTRQIVEGLR
ncbi:MAG: zinc ABC transporter substrate-binding protein [Chloroflexi bacterium]|nr:zinc ABC transporter substrate-binding protein [Chloroflexota bacterium]